jgi:hypothetical protein
MRPVDRFILLPSYEPFLRILYTFTPGATGARIFSHPSTDYQKFSETLRQFWYDTKGSLGHNLLSPGTIFNTFIFISKCNKRRSRFTNEYSYRHLTF